MENILSNVLTEEYVEAIGRPIMENILKAHVDSNYQQATMHFTNEFKSDLSIEEFKQAVKCELSQLGSISSTNYLGYLNKNKSFLLLWKVKYEKGMDDVLWKLHLNELSENAQVECIWFG